VTVILTNEQDALPIDEDHLTGEIDRLARGAGFTGDLSVALVTDAVIHELNRDFLGHDYPTDVLAFPLGDGEGEIVVSAERAIAEAGERGVSPGAELRFYIAHGILHLAGHDDHDPREARRMHAVALRLLKGLGYRNRVAARQRGELE
jgi:probable rRNA maturation factor